MEKAVQSKELYDSMYTEGGFEGVYNLPYQHSAYYPLFKQVLHQVVRNKSRSVLEVGCGTGAFAKMVMDRTNLNYQGFDFSSVAVEKAIARTGRGAAFYEGDATSHAPYEGKQYDCVVCTEVLEHIEKDLDAISQWPAGTFCVCSVPNFDADSHVRFFRTEEEVRTRYEKLIDITDIVRVKKPALADISRSNVLRALRWSRYRPRQLLEILGIGSFDSLGGWFCFWGIKRG
jgi:SAM-dependent methyltransferase